MTELAKINLMYFFRAIFLYTRLFQPNCAIIGFNAPTCFGEEEKGRKRRRRRERGGTLFSHSFSQGENKK